MIYWFGFIEELDIHREKGIVLMDHFPEKIVQMNSSLLRSNGVVSMTNTALDQEGILSRTATSFLTAVSSQKYVSDTVSPFPNSGKNTSASSFLSVPHSVQCSSSVDSITELGNTITDIRISDGEQQTKGEQSERGGSKQEENTHENTSENSSGHLSVTPTNTSDAHTPI